ncbi:MAG: FCD domain-containing protein, partial [Terriglobia bacterium]
GADDDFLYSVHTYHMRFHLRIAEIGGNSLLRRAIEREQVLVFNWLFDTASRQRRMPRDFHSELAAALVGSGVEAAEQAMRAHIRYRIDQVLEAMRPVETGNGWRMPRKADSRGTTGNSRYSS